MKVYLFLASFILLDIIMTPPEAGLPASKCGCSDDMEIVNPQPKPVDKTSSSVAPNDSISNF